MTKFAIDIGESFFGDEHFLRDMTGLGSLVSIFVSNAIAIAGVVFLFLLIMAGYNMISGAGSGNPQQVARGKEIAVAAIVGFILVVAAYWIVAIIQNATGTDLL